MNILIPENKRQIIVLPENNIAEYNGKIYNWFIGDFRRDELRTNENRNKKSIWEAWGISKGWNTLNAKLYGEFNQETRELLIITELE